MKIVIINAVYGVRSTGRTYRELHDYYTEQGHICKVFYGEQPCDLPDANYMGSKASHKMAALRSRISGRPGYYNAGETRKLIRFLKEFQPDIVHLGNLHGHFVHIPMLLRYLAESDTATVLTLHDCYFYTGGCTHYTVNRCYKWRTGCGNCAYYKKQGAWFFDQTNQLYEYKQRYFHAMHKLAVVGVSKWISEEAKRSKILDSPKKRQTIPDWIDIEKFRPSKSKVRAEDGFEDKYVILGVASGWSDKKGLNHFVTLSVKLAPDEVIVLIGNMPSKDALPDNIISIPATDLVEKLVEWYNAADVFLQLSPEETFGKVTAEALACGTPIVTNPYTANPELAGDGCGLVAEPQDADALYAAIREIRRNGKQHYSAHCREFAVSRFSKDICTRKMLQLYEDLLQEEQKTEYTDR